MFNRTELHIQLTDVLVLNFPTLLLILLLINIKIVRSFFGLPVVDN